MNRSDEVIRRAPDLIRSVLAGCLVLLLTGSAVHAHTGTQNVFYEGNIGPYAARIIIQRPDVVPGLSDITIRLLEGTADRITVLPLKWNLGKQGAPTPDEALPVRGEPGLFSAQLWFMESGSQSVEIHIQGKTGEGSLQIPVAVTATRVETLPPGLGAILTVLAVILILIFLGIVAAAVRESVLEKGARPTRKRLWLSRLAALLALGLFGSGLYGGKLWWDAEAAIYRNERLFRPVAADVEVRREGARRVVRIELPEQELRSRSPIVPDHGKLMHLVLIGVPDMNSFAHLHPLKLNRQTFVTPVPDDLPGGEYDLHAEVTYETGFSESITNRIRLPEFTAATGGPGVTLEADPDDAWIIGSSGISITNRMADLGDGFRLEWLDAGYVTEGEDLSLRFRAVDSAGDPVAVRPYMGMLGHLFMRSHDGHLFVHLHPAGSFSMVAQQLFDLRARGEAPSAANFSGSEAFCEIPGVEASQDYWNAQKSAGADQSFSFPWKFMEHGPHRIWVQVKIRDTIRTAVFDVDVKHPVQ